MKTKLGANLKKWREAKNLNQADISDMLGYSSSQFVSNWERGLAVPPPRLWKALATIYGVKTADIFNIVLKSHLTRAEASLRRRAGL